MSRVLARTGVYASLVLATVVVVLPIAVVVLGAFKTDQEYLSTQPLDPPRDWSNLANFVTAFRDGEMVSGFLNTAVVLALAVTGTVLVGAGAAYAIDRFRFVGRKAVLGAFLVATLVPGVTTQVNPFHSSIRSWSGSAPTSPSSRAATLRARPAAGPLGANAAVWAAVTGSTHACSPWAVRPCQAHSTYCALFISREEATRVWATASSGSPRCHVTSPRATSAGSCPMSPSVTFVAIREP